MEIDKLALGDFNEILFHHKKEGGWVRTQWQLQAFHDTLEECGLVDIRYIGDIIEWLDQGVVSAQWSIMFPNAKLVNAQTLKSDHWLIVVDTEYLQDQLV